VRPIAERAPAPVEFAELAAGPRVLVRRSGAPRNGARCVVYWMQRAMRIVDNAALDVAIQAGNLLDLPVVVFFSVIPDYPHANLRHYHFMAQGLRDVEADAAERGVGFVVRRHPDNSLEAFLEEAEAALLIGDENPCREPERWRRVLARRLKLPYWTVDADVVVPSRVFDRSFVLMHHFRPHLKRELPKFLVAPKTIEPLHPWKPWKALPSFSLSGDITAGFGKLDRAVKPVDSFTGGTHAALKRVAEFVGLESGSGIGSSGPDQHPEMEVLRLRSAQGAAPNSAQDGGLDLERGSADAPLARYDVVRNHPELRGTSRLSPYLHFGNIGPLTVALAVEEAVRQGKATASARDRFLEQLIGWRELSVLFVRHEPNYDNWECAAPWARKTLVEHTGDPRPHCYTLKQLERAETVDELWNAAQREMVETGWMHGYMRMYWAKKILEWAPDPARAFEWAVELNDRYELDGRDPNGYAGIAWALVGRHDRPWFNRPVFGLVRTMTGASMAKKFDAGAYIREQSDRLL
jgi:deoxyribodipyrimidine photo-lyase